MPQSLVQIYLHIVFSTKDRRPFLRDNKIRERLHSYLVGACKGQKCPSQQVGGVEDHVHLLVRLGKAVGIATLVRELKRESSKWMKTELNHRDFKWQSGYGTFSISPNHVDPVTEYIRKQEEHHKKESFQDEFRRLCRKYNLEIDERYAWE